MRKLTCFLPLVLLSVLVGGCNTFPPSTITNVTPSRQVGNAAGLYPVEIAWETRQQSIRPQSLRPVVIVGETEYKMEKTPVVRNRWNTLIPIAAGQKVVFYRVKMNYEYNGVPVPRKNSKLSPQYRLEITPR